mmetsp:Transcript_41414/g.96737  ORF Transcript_41414/g.96737 Transcript_41414/m.96737 type:complete len:270 (+) Transcript_41414:243-1052(+)
MSIQSLDFLEEKEFLPRESFADGTLTWHEGVGDGARGEGALRARCIKAPLRLIGAVVDEASTWSKHPFNAVATTRRTIDEHLQARRVHVLRGYLLDGKRVIRRARLMQAATLNGRGGMSGSSQVSAASLAGQTDRPFSRGTRGRGLHGIVGEGAQLRLLGPNPLQGAVVARGNRGDYEAGDHHPGILHFLVEALPEPVRQNFQQNCTGQVEVLNLQAVSNMAQPKLSQHGNHLRRVLESGYCTANNFNKSSPEPPQRWRFRHVIRLLLV